MIMQYLRRYRRKLDWKVKRCHCEQEQLLDAAAIEKEYLTKRNHIRDPTSTSISTITDAATAASSTDTSLLRRQWNPPPALPPSRDRGTSAIQGIVLNLSQDMQLSSQAFKKMYNLRFLNFYDSLFAPSNFYRKCNSRVHIPNGLGDLPGKPRFYLDWISFNNTAIKF
ncbi:hypothetical protein LWI29_009784 [Acer saccharum]|uniref:Uncharacterized protein n=1 Tax=Acer saccharum TaxID=4024 RepID=A0AA39SKA9_ACESA|nr:hypothetical protein LWI29_009784 [Acer saccharum]